MKKIIFKLWARFVEIIAAITLMFLYLFLFLAPVIFIETWKPLEFLIQILWTVFVILPLGLIFFDFYNTLFPEQINKIKSFVKK